MTAPGEPVRIGHLHPTHTAERDFREIFHAFGFEVFEGPEIETEWWNFEALNIPPDHPARDLWDTLYVAEPGSDPPRPAEDGTILRTHTSPVQIRAMQALTPPIRVITPGRCFRYENVAADRSFEFFQIEALVVDRDTSPGRPEGDAGGAGARHVRVARRGRASAPATTRSPSRAWPSTSAARCAAAWAAPPASAPAG